MSFIWNPPDLLLQFAEYKALSQQVADCLVSQQNSFKEGARVLTCAHELWKVKDNHADSVFSTWFCKHQQCPLCQWRKSLRWQRRVHSLLDHHPRLLEGKWLYLTLTSGDCEINSVRYTVKQMLDAFRRLSMRRFWADNVVGGIRFVEVSESVKGSELARPHLHCLLWVRPSMYQGKNYMREALWSSEWQSCLFGPFAPQLDVQRLQAGSEDMHSQLLRTVAYSTKARIQLPMKEWLLEVNVQMKGLRLVEPFGELRYVLMDIKRREKYGLLQEDRLPFGRGGLVLNRWDPVSQSYSEMSQDSGFFDSMGETTL